MSGDIKDLCCDISDIQNPMCWGCYVIWYEREHEIWVKENEEFFTQNGIE